MFYRFVVQNFLSFHGNNVFSFHPLASITAILGQNGVGKSTFIKALAIVLGAASRETLSGDESYLEITHWDGMRYRVTGDGSYFIDDHLIDRQTYLVQANRHFTTHAVFLDHSFWRGVMGDPTALMEYLLQFDFDDPYATEGFDLEREKQTRRDYEEVDNEFKECTATLKKLNAYNRKITKAQTQWNELRAAKERRLAALREKNMLARQIINIQLNEAESQITHWKSTKEDLLSSETVVKAEVADLEQQLESAKHAIEKCHSHTTNISESFTKSILDLRKREVDVGMIVSEKLHLLRLQKMAEECQITFYQEMVNLARQKSEGIKSDNSDSDDGKFISNDHSNWFILDSLVTTISRFHLSLDEVFQELNWKSQKLQLDIGRLHVALNKSSQAQYGLKESITLSLTRCRALENTLESLIESQSRLSTGKCFRLLASTRLLYPKVIGTLSDFLVVPEVLDPAFELTIPQLKRLVKLAIRMKNEEISTVDKDDTEGEHRQPIEDRVFVVETEADALCYSRQTSDLVFIPYFLNHPPRSLESKKSRLSPEMLQSYPDIHILSDLVEYSDTNVQRIANYALENYIVVKSSEIAQDVTSNLNWFPRNMIVCDHDANIYNNKGWVISSSIFHDEDDQTQFHSLEEHQSAILEELTELKLDLIGWDLQLREQTSMSSSLTEAINAHGLSLKDVQSFQDQIRDMMQQLKVDESEMLAHSKLMAPYGTSINPIMKWCEESQSKLEPCWIRLTKIEKQTQSLQSLAPCSLKDEVDIVNQTSNSSRYHDSVESVGLEGIISLREELSSGYEHLVEVEIQNLKITASLRALRDRMNTIDLQLEEINLHLGKLEPLVAKWSREIHELNLEMESILESQQESIRHQKDGVIQSNPQSNIAVLKSRLLQLQTDLKNSESAMVSEIKDTVVKKEGEVTISKVNGLTSRLEIVKIRRKTLSKQVEQWRDLKYQWIRSIIDRLTPHMQNIYTSFFSRTTTNKCWISFDLVNDANVEQGVMFSAVPLGKSFFTVDQMSSGEFTLAFMALQLSIAIARKTKFLLVDEIDSHLDFWNCERLRDALVDLSGNGRYKWSLILVSHHRYMYRSAEEFLALYKLGETSKGFIYATIPPPDERFLPGHPEFRNFFPESATEVEIQLGG